MALRIGKAVMDIDCAKENLMAESSDNSKRFLLRVEGVNLANVIDDTDQLSTRRGGGLMILNAATQLRESLAEDLQHRLIEIATGASIGLFELQTEGDAEDVRTIVETHLREGALEYEMIDGRTAKLPLKHGTFVADVVPVSDPSNVQQAVQLAVAKNRWRQMREPSLSLHGLWDKGTEPCELDRTRVANTTCCLKDNRNIPASETSRDRLGYGRGARQRFYKREIGSLREELFFIDDLQSLSKRSSGDGIDVPRDSHLADKLAVFYVDGNGFGSIGRESLTKEGTDGYRQWSSQLRAHHRSLLKGLIDMAIVDATWKNEERIRLETLLWGGDEILWVTPAWKGWEVAKWFFTQPHNVRGHELTYGCGLVFCHAKAPITNIVALAHRLGDLAKAARGGENVHRLAYEVLESYDDISGDLDDHRRRFLPANRHVSDLVIDPSQLAECWDVLQQIATSPDFPMRQLYMLTKKWRNGEDFAQHEKRLKNACEDAGVNVQHLTSTLGDPIAWLHLLQLLPYLPVPAAMGDDS